MEVIPEDVRTWNWRRRAVPVNAQAIAAAVDAMRFCLDHHYDRAVETELEVCLAGCKNDSDRAQVFLQLMPHLKRQVERQVKQDSERFRNRIYSGRNW